MSHHAWPLGRALLVGVWLLAFTGGLAVVMTRPVEPTMPIYLELVEALRSGLVASSFEPLGYPWLLSLAPASSPETAVTMLHLASFLVLITGGLLVGVRSLDGAAATPARRLMVVAACAALLLSPYGLVNLSRVNDNGVNVLLTFLLCLLVYGAGSRYGHLAIPAAGALLGAMVFVRPNCISVLPLAMAVAFVSPSRLTHGAAAATVVAGSAASYIACALLATGSAFFWPSNGPYNLFAGNNPASLAALQQDYNAEPSLAAGLEWCGVSAPPREVPAADYLACARRFVSEEPVAALTLTAYKSYNMLFRPNLRLADGSLEIAAQVASLLLPMLWWGASAASLFATGRLMDWKAATMIVLFTLPFAVTNSDPRFRLPLEPIYAVSLMRAFGARPLAL